MLMYNIRPIAESSFIDKLFNPTSNKTIFANPLERKIYIVATVLLVAATFGLAHVGYALVKFAQQPNTQWQSNGVSNYPSRGLTRQPKGLVNLVNMVISEKEKKSAPSVSSPVPKSKTRFDGACERGEIYLVNELLKTNRADAERVGPDEMTPLARACKGGNLSVVNALIEANVNIDFTGNQFRRSALMIACDNGHFGIAQALLDAGAKADLTDVDGMTALSFARMHRRPRENEFLSQLEAVDYGVTQEVMFCKELAHRYGLEGKIEILGNEINLTGWFRPIALSLLSSKVQSYYKSLSDSMDAYFAPPLPATPLTDPADPLLDQTITTPWTKLCSGLSQETQSLIRKRLTPESLKRILSETEEAIAGCLPSRMTGIQVIDGKPGALLLGMGDPSGVSGRSQDHHTVAMAFVKNGDKWRVARCNKGFGKGNEPGIRIHTITAPFDFSEYNRLVPEDFRIHTITAPFDPNKYNRLVAEDFHLQGFERDHRLTEKVYIPQKAQKVGNCNIANSNGMELALLYLHLEPILGHDAALELAQAIKKGRCEDSREQILEKYRDYHSQPRSVPVNNDLLRQIEQKKAAKAAKKEALVSQPKKDKCDLGEQLVITSCELPGKEDVDE